jgi:hypothetical protein
MPNQFKCNDDTDTGRTDTERIDSYNAVYDYYYDKVIRNPDGESNFVVPTTTIAGQTWANTYCGSNGCPSNFSEDTITNSLYYTDVQGTFMVKNKDLARYLNDCAGKMNLDITKPGYNTAHPATMLLKDTTYPDLVDKRNDLDRKMKEILAVQGAMVNEHQNFIDGSVYTTLLWTVMATSLVYYVFTKI